MSRIFVQDSIYARIVKKEALNWPMDYALEPIIHWEQISSILGSVKSISVCHLVQGHRMALVADEVQDGKYR